MINITLWEPSSVAIDHTALCGLAPLHSLRLQEMSQTHKTWSAGAVNEYQKAKDGPIDPRHYFWNLQRLGSSVIEMYATTTLLKECDTVSPVAQEAMKNCLTSRITHSYLGYYLGLYEKLKGKPRGDPEEQNRSQGLAADAFEAYIGALCEDSAGQEADPCKQWLRSMWSSSFMRDLMKLGKAAESAFGREKAEKRKARAAPYRQRGIGARRRETNVPKSSRANRGRDDRRGRSVNRNKGKTGLDVKRGRNDSQQGQPLAEVTHKQGTAGVVKRKSVVKQWHR